MKLHQHTTAGKLITGCGEGWVAVNGERKETSLLIGNDLVKELPEVGTDYQAAINATEEQIKQLSPQVLLLGTGKKYVLASVDWVAKMATIGIGVEVMDTAAACRTFNVLALEGRKVLAILLVETKSAD